MTLYIDDCIKVGNLGEHEHVELVDYNNDDINSTIEVNLLIRMLNNYFYHEFKNVLRDCRIWCEYNKKENIFDCYYGNDEFYESYEVYQYYKKGVFLGYAIHHYC